MKVSKRLHIRRKGVGKSMIRRNPTRKPIHISKDLRNFFEVEIRNEAFGGVSPSNLNSAWESWRQAPVWVLYSWTKDTSRDELIYAENELKALMKRYKDPRRVRLESLLRKYQTKRYSTVDINEEQYSKFLKLASELSPENLTCDGELSRGQVNIKYKRLKKQWLRLERVVGRSVTESEVWDWGMRRREAR